ncbi:MAG TPA: DUF2309 domain-containing protein [Drouetiella sp.]|jgi:uncharacterized protein
MKFTKDVSTFNIETAIAQASQCINSYYPLTNFIAANALKNWENIPFEEALNRSTELFGSAGYLPLAEYRAMYESGRIAPGDLQEAFEKVACADSQIHENNNARDRTRENKHAHDQIHDRESRVFTLCQMLDQTSGSSLVSIINRQLVKWCGAYFDRTQAQWKPETEGQGLYSFWKELARYDLSMTWHGVHDWSCSLDALPNNSSEAICRTLEDFDLKEQDVVPYLTQHIAQLPGFASYVKWRQFEAGEEGILSDYLAIRLHYEKSLAQVASNKLHGSANLGLLRLLLDEDIKTSADNKSKVQDNYAPIWQNAYELNYRNRLLASLQKGSAPITDNACCQLVFCIDVRSEPIRRELEQLGPYSTYGFAGFFGMSMRLTELGSSLPLNLCPVLLKPEKSVSEHADFQSASRKISWQALKASAVELKKKLKCNLSGAFGLVELMGLCSLVPLFAKTFAPSKTNVIWRNLENAMSGRINSQLYTDSFSLEQKIALARGALKGMGLTQFGKLIVICGHKSTSVNNPFASALDCGACGGNGGGFSARLAAKILNAKDVRSALLANDIRIPEGTTFLAAEHDTTTDRFQFYDLPDLSEEQLVIFERLKKDLAAAGESLRQARVKTLPQSCVEKFNNPLERAHDWAQTAPEWGLAGNAAFIAAPRSISKESDLEGRVFLHSYEYSLDEDNKVLELIMTAPLVVAQWINMQYYFSTVDNKKFGSGSKVLHNVIGDFGVMQGAQSDLQIGLPLQSLMTADVRMHEPMRLLAILRAPLKSIDAVLNSHPEVRTLVANRWIRLVGLDPATEAFYEAEDSGVWRKVEPRPAANKTEIADGEADASWASIERPKQIFR